MYLIAAVNNMFADVSISIDDIKSSWAGLTPSYSRGGKTRLGIVKKG